MKFNDLFAASPSPVVSPCASSPCGMYAECREIGDYPSCSCLPEYQGSPPNCRPECTINPDCPSNRVCMRQKCSDPCAGSCGINALCSVVNHTPVCTCPDRYTGDPFTSCRPLPEDRKISDLGMRTGLVIYSKKNLREIFKTIVIL